MTDMSGYLDLERGCFMRPKRRRTSSLTDAVEQECEYLLVEAALEWEQRRDWTVRSRVGTRYRAVLTVDEWTDAPLVEIRDRESDEVLKTMKVCITCWFRD